ncbi:MAG: hypothetical protein IT241_09090, partial [Bacteroidia bacterium]|nr:hypothetical protein [Bacteroidia bacterium]
MLKKTITSILSSLMAFMLLITIAQAQMTVTIGNPGSGTSSYQIPVNSLWNYSYTQQIVLASEIGMDGAITKLTFYWNAGSLTNNNDWTVYMGYKSSSTFSSTTDWVPLANLTQVFSGNIVQPLIAGFTCEVLLTTPFNYAQANGNLVIAVDQNDPSYTYTSNMFMTTAGTGRAIHYYSDGTNPDPASPPTANAVLAVFNTMQLEIYPSSPCSGTPSAGTTITSQTPVCPSQSFTLSLAGATYDSGINYQWQSADDAAFTMNVANLGTSSTQGTSQTTAKYYRCQLTCTNSGLSASSTPVYVAINPNLPGGNYTINSGLPTGGSNFQSFNDFIAAMNCGIAGAIVVNVAAGSGPYNEQVEFGEIIGASSVNTITINGNGNVLTYASSSSGNPSTLELNGTDYMTINNLTVNATGAQYAFACHLWNQADNNTFNNCTFNAPANGSYSTQVPFSVSGSKTSAITSGVSGNNNVVSNSTIFSGYYGCVMAGNSSLASTGNQVINCNILDFYFYGSYNTYQNGVVISHNTVERPTSTNFSSFYGIYISTGCTNALVEKNKIRNPCATNTSAIISAYVIYCLNDASPGNENKFYNNVISDINSNGSIYGMYMTGSDYWEAYHNTISLDQTTSTSTSPTYGIYATGTLAKDVRNNIVSISRGGTGTKYCVYYTTPAVTISDHNVLYMNAAAGTRYVGYNGTGYTTLSAWQAGSGKDLNSVSVDPMYLAPGSYDYTPNNGLVNDIGAPLGVTTDINNATRSVTTPDPGAYEFSLGGLDAAISWVSPTSPATVGLYPVTVNISNTQAQTITSLNLSYNDGGSPVTQLFTGLNITAGNNQNLTFSTQYNLASSVTMTVEILSVNGGSDAVSANNTDTYFLCVSLSGTYTINSNFPTGGINFQTFTDAINALSCGISSPIVFNVASGSGPYNESVVIPEITGTSAVNTITINGNGRTLSYTGNAGQPNTLSLNGADYFIINNLNIEGLDATYAIACHLYGGADNNAFNNCTFEVNITSTTSLLSAFVLNGSPTDVTTSGNSGNNNLISGCTMIGGGTYQVAILGSSISPFNVNNQLVNCNLQDFYSYGIRNMYCQNTIIRGNTIERLNRTNTTTVYAIYLSTSSLNCTVEKNRVQKLFESQQSSTSSAYCLYNGASGSLGLENKWYNNVVSDINSNGAIYGFYSLGYTNVQFYHNTISLDGTTATAGTTYGMYGYGTGLDIKNNNVSITRTGTGTKYC